MSTNPDVSMKKAERLEILAKQPQRRSKKHTDFMRDI
jgi:hypothetical protein